MNPSMRYAYLTLAIFCVVLVTLLGFRGTSFTKPPRQVFPNAFFPQMTIQSKYKPQASSQFFADGRADRPLPAGVVSRDAIVDDDVLASGKTANGEFLHGFPAAITIHQSLPSLSWAVFASGVPGCWSINFL